MSGHIWPCFVTFHHTRDCLRMKCGATEVLINAITLTLMSPNKCSLQPDIVWTKLHRRLSDLNSLRQLEIIAVENKSISRRVNSPLLSISSNYLSIRHFSAETASPCEEQTTQVSWDTQMESRQHSDIRPGDLFLSQAEMSCLGSSLYLCWVSTPVFPTHSSITSAFRKPLKSVCSQLVLNKQSVRGIRIDHTSVVGSGD